MKKILLYLLLCCHYTLSFSQVNEKILLNEEFNDNKNYWNLYSDLYFSVEIKNGSLVMENKDKMMRIRGLWVRIDTSYDFRIVTTPRMISGDQSYGYGFYFGASDLRNSYYFEISGGHYMLFKYEKGKDSTLINWTKHSRINAGYNANNILMMSKEKDLWKFYSNGEFITSYKALPFFGKEVGFVVEGPQKVEFGHLLVKNMFPLVKAEGSLCDMLPKIREQWKSDFNTIYTDEPYTLSGGTATRTDRRSQNNTNNTSNKRFKTTMIITDALANYVDGTNSYNHVSLWGVYNTKEEAIKKQDSLRTYINSCLRDYEIVKSGLYSKKLPYYDIRKKVNGGYRDEYNRLWIRHDSLRNQYFVEVIISNAEGKTCYFINSKPDNSKLTGQLKQLTGYAKDEFIKIRGQMIPVPNKDTNYYKKYKTTLTLEGAKRSYIDVSYSEISHVSVYGDSLKNNDADLLFNSLAEKMKKALGSEWIYVERNKDADAVFKYDRTIVFFNRSDDGDNRGFQLRKQQVSLSGSDCNVDIRAINHWSIRY